MKQKNDFFTRSVKDVSYPSFEYSMKLLDMADRLMEYRSKEVKYHLPDSDPLHLSESGRRRVNPVYTAISKEIDQLQEKAFQAQRNYLRTVKDYYKTRPNYVEHGEIW